MSEILFLFGRRPSDLQWLESADREELATLVAYLVRRANSRRSHGH